MRPDHRRLFEMLAAEAPPAVESGAISLSALVKRWLDAGTAVSQHEQRIVLEDVCRQIDVKKKLFETYDENWRPTTPDRRAHPSIVGGVVAVLLANAWSDSGDTGWRLKCANSALKALDLCPTLPHGAALRAWAIETLDRCGSEVADT